MCGGDVMSDPNEAVENLRLDGGRLNALADSIRHLLTPDKYKWLRKQRLAETKRDVHVKARVDSELMKSELGFPDNVRLLIVGTLHYGGHPTDYTTRLVIGRIETPLIDKAEEREKWIRSCPARLAKRLKLFES
jgi:hypothetical protein